MAISVDDYLVHPADTTDHTPGRTLPDIFDAAVAAFGDAPAVLGAGEPRTWIQWRDESQALAAGLRTLGIGVGDVVAVHLPNCWEYLLTHVAVARLGAVMLPLHIAYGERDLLALSQQARARLLILPSTKQPPPAKVASLAHVLTVEDAAGAGKATGTGSFTALIQDHRGEIPEPAEVSPDRPFVVLPSSGTVSGRPKLCLHSHGTLLSNAARVAADGRASGDDTIVSASPFTHLFGLLSVHLSLLTGGRQALLRGWGPDAFLDLADRTGANVLFAVPAQLRDVAQRLHEQPATGRLRLREVRTGGAAVPASLVTDVRQLTGATTIVQWGMSELGAGTVTLPDDPAEVAVRSIGRPLSGSSARVMDETGRECPDGQTGEFQYRGPQLFHGYLYDPTATSAAFTADGWLRTGDLASRNDDGTFSYQGRDAEVINVGGLKFSASEIEGLLSDLPQLAAAAVAARHDARLGQYPCLIAAPRSGATIDLPTVRAHLTAKGVAEYKLPLELILVDGVPMTPTGKVARGLLAALLDRPAARRPSATGHWRDRLAAARPGPDRSRLALALILELLAGLAPGDQDPERSFRELGVTSLGAVRLAVELSTASGLSLPTTVVFDHPTPMALARHLVDLAVPPVRDEPGHATEPPVRSEPSVRSEPTGEDPIVITGMGCRFPGGVSSPEDLWRLLAEGRETAGPFPTDRGWDLDRLRHPDPAHPGRSSTHFGHFLTDAAGFDAPFFDISSREALAMDPQQRLLLETSWEALERAGLDPTALHGSDTGVFVGQMAGDYAPRISEAPERYDGLILTGNASSVASGRLSYTLGLIGPSLTVDTACSSSLVALHLAVQALRRGECSIALAAGATVMATPASFVDFSRQGLLAPDGRCKAFAATADGAGWSEGIGVVVLERLSSARENGHPILATVAGSAVNQDGASNGLTAPSGLAQQRVIRKALAEAGLVADQIDVIEAHGTGTPLGDRIEAAALHDVYGTDRAAEQPIWLGSVKSNIGHAQAAAGIAGVIKTVLALRHGELPRTLHADTPHPPATGNSTGAIRLLTDPRPWRRSAARPRRAGVSAFGISGTNAHVILQEPPEPEPDPAPAADGHRAPAWVLSARTAPALRELAGRLLPVAESADPYETARALATSRPSFEHRAVLVPRSHPDLVAGLRGIAAGTLPVDAAAGRVRPGEGRTVFVFPGQGGQWEGMAAALLAESDVFARAMAACDDALAPYVDWSVRAVLRCEAGQPPLERIEVVQTTLFAVMVALAGLWGSVGVRPGAVVGHSTGEIAAAYVSGALSLDDAARVVARRAAALRELVGGRMAAVALPRDGLTGMVAEYQGALSVAVDNGPRSTVVSGDADAVADLVAELVGRDIRATVLASDVASHCPQVARIEDTLTESLTGLRPRPADVPFFSTVVPGPLDTTELTGAYWYQNLRRTVEFRAAVRALLEAGHTDFIEVSPHPLLTQPILEIAESAGRTATAVGTLRRDEGDLRRFLLSAAHAYAGGAPVDWPTLFTGRPARHVELPCYPFQHERYWLPTSTVHRPEGAGHPEPAVPATAARHADERLAPESEQALLELIQEQAATVLGRPDGTRIAPDEAFAALGTTSLTAVELRTRLAHLLDLPVPSTAVFDHGTPRALTAHLWSLLHDRADALGRSARQGPPDCLDPLVRYACQTGHGVTAVDLITTAARLRTTFTAGAAEQHPPEPVSLGTGSALPILICFPSLLPTSGPHEYAALAEALAGTPRVLALPQPGFAAGQPLPYDLDALVTAHTIALERHTGGEPLLLCGHSSGGFVAHAVATRLEERGRPAAGLILLDSLWPDDRLWSEVLPGTLAGVITQQPLAASGISDDRLTATGGYLRLFAGWRPAPIDTPALLLRAAEPGAVSGTDGQLGTPWQLPHTEVEVPGDHFTMLADHTAELADAIGHWWKTGRPAPDARTETPTTR